MSMFWRRFCNNIRLKTLTAFRSAQSSQSAIERLEFRTSQTTSNLECYQNTADIRPSGRNAHWRSGLEISCGIEAISSWKWQITITK